MASADVIINKIKNGRTAVLGLGVSNLPLVELLLNMGADITVHDKKDKKDIKEAERFERLGVKFVTGEGYLDRIDADVIFRSPGIRPDKSGISQAVARGSVLTSEMELFFELTPAKIIAVTGSDGKTTTTTVIYNLLKKEFEGIGRKVFVGGNIGTPLLDKASQMTKDDIAVLELSSFQLFTMKRSPDRAVLTNVTPNHLDWHTDMDEYTDAKCNIFRYGAKHLTTNGANEICQKILNDTATESTAFSSTLSKEEIIKQNPSAKSVFYLKNGKICRFDGENEAEILDAEDILVPGKHNIENYMAAISASWGLVSLETIRYVAKTFGGVEHRLEFVRELDGVRYYNSSIDSSPTRTAAALSALPKRPIVICGGYDKNIPFEPLAKVLCERAKAVVLTGATAEKIYDALQAEPSFSEFALPVKTEKDFESAVICAKGLAKDGDIVLLSPACASFDAFKNFEERGNCFKNIVKGF